MPGQEDAKEFAERCRGVRRRYHFSLGNSSKGPIGYCAAVIARSEREAIEKLQKQLPEELKVDPCGLEYDPDIEYIRAYFNDKAIRVKDIDEIEDVPEKEG